MTNVKAYHNIAMHLSNRFETHVEFNGALMAYTVTNGSHTLFAASGGLFASERGV